MNSEAEPIIDEFLRRVSTSGRERNTTILDKIRLLSQPFVGPIERNSIPLIAYSDEDRRKVHSAEDTSSQHVDIQNPNRIRELSEDLGLFTDATLREPSLFLQKHTKTHLLRYIEMRAKQNRDWSISSVSIGEEYLAKGEDEKAASAFTHAIEIDPGCESAMLHMANIYSKNNEYEKAVKACERILLLDHTNNHAFDLLQRILSKSGNKEYRNTNFFTSLIAKRRTSIDERKQSVRKSAVSSLNYDGENHQEYDVKTSLRGKSPPRYRRHRPDYEKRFNDRFGRNRKDTYRPE